MNLKAHIVQRLVDIWDERINDFDRDHHADGEEDIEEDDPDHETDMTDVHLEDADQDHQITDHQEEHRIIDHPVDLHLHTDVDHDHDNRLISQISKPLCDISSLYYLYFPRQLFFFEFFAFFTILPRIMRSHF